MDYVPPIGSPANTSYSDGNPALGVEGSPLPGKAVESVMREIVAVITGAEIAPDANDYTQLRQAIQKLIASAVTDGDLQIPQEAQVGTVRETYSTTAQDGWLMMTDQTIGKAGSTAGAADNKYETLYKMLWNGLDNTACPVTGGRGASADADWLANKPLRLPLRKGRAGIGAGAGTGLTNRVLGRSYGGESLMLAANQIPSVDVNVPAGMTMSSDGDSQSIRPDMYPTVDGGGPYVLDRDVKTGVTKAGDQPVPIVPASTAANYEIKY